MKSYSRLVTLLITCLAAIALLSGISSAAVPPGAITNPMLADFNVTSSKISPGSMGVNEIANWSVPWYKLDSYVPQYLAYQIHDKDSILNVKDYGAVGDGYTDDAWAFQNALDSAGYRGGTIVWVSAGTYKIASHLTIPAHVTLEGVNRAPKGNQETRLDK